MLPTRDNDDNEWQRDPNKFQENCPSKHMLQINNQGKLEVGCGYGYMSNQSKLEDVCHFLLACHSMLPSHK